MCVCRVRRCGDCERGLTEPKNSLGHVYCASEMAHSHNTIIRGLNAILQQAPNVPAAKNDDFVAQDVTDLLFYVKSWAKMVHHHHWVEESYIFPEIERVSNRPGLMDDPKHQHELFHDGLEALLKYASDTPPGDYRWEHPGGMKAIIDSFSKHLTDHLYDEIDVLLGMSDVDSVELRDTWAKAEKIAKQTGNVAMLVRCRGPVVHISGQAEFLTCSERSMTCSRRFLGVLTRPTRAATTFHPFPVCYLTSSSTGSLRGTVLGDLIHATGGETRDLSRSDRKTVHNHS